MWWLTVEQVIAANASIDFVIDGQIHRLSTRDSDEKQARSSDLLAAARFTA